MELTAINPAVTAIVESAVSLTDNDMAQLIDALLKSHRLVLNPQIVVQMQKLVEPVDTFKNEVPQENKRTV